MTTSTGHLTLADMSWALYIVVPFTPLVLECFGFYRHARRRPRHETILPIAKALAVMGLVLGLISLLLHPRESSRLILGIGVPIVAFLLLLRDRATCRWVSLPEPP